MKFRNKAASVTEEGPAFGSEATLSKEMMRYYKDLAGQIEIALPRQGARALVLSGSMAGEGTTEVAIGLGLALAGERGKKVVIVDCNFHHPEIHRRFGADEVGLGDYLTGSITLDKAMANTVVPNVYVIPLGRGLSSLVGFSKSDLRGLLEELKSRFDFVLIDAAPLGTYTDCVALCDLVDAVILVVKHGATRREVVMRTRDLVTRAGGKVLGVILNKRRFPIPEFLYRKL